MILVIAALALPVGVCVLIAFSKALAAMSDPTGGMVLARAALALGVVWTLDLVALVIILGYQAVVSGERSADEE